MDWVTKAGLAAISCEVVEDDVRDDGDASLVAPEHHVLQVFAAAPEIANAIPSRLKGQNVHVPGSNEIERTNLMLELLNNLKASGWFGFFSSLTGRS